MTLLEGYLIDTDWRAAYRGNLIAAGTEKLSNLPQQPSNRVACYLFSSGFLVIARLGGLRIQPFPDLSVHYAVWCYCERRSVGYLALDDHVGCSQPVYHPGLLAFSFAGGFQTVEIAISRVFNVLVGDSGSKIRGLALGCTYGAPLTRRPRSGFGPRNACLNVRGYSHIGINLLADGKGCEGRTFLWRRRCDPWSSPVAAIVGGGAPSGSRRRQLREPFPARVFSEGSIDGYRGR